jgi:dienelactone hydrolase
MKHELNTTVILLGAHRKKNPVLWSKLIVIGLILMAFPAFLMASTGNWTSKATGGNIVYTVTESFSPAKDIGGAYVTVVYLENLNFNKLGGNSNETDVAWLLSKGYRVIELNYANHINAVSPNINADIIDINDAIFAGSFCGLTNCSKYQSYVLFEGYRISRNVSYFKDDPTIYNYPAGYTEGDSLHMDIIYPANAAVTVPVVLSFSYSNSLYTSKDQRLNLGNTLAQFNDSFLEGAPANGIAWAIADHPKYCEWGQGKPTPTSANKLYASYETNPDAAQKVKSAIRTLRALGTGLGLSDKIGIYGFSRGSTAGSMAVGDRIVTAFENAGLHIGTSDDVQAAALGSGVFDYTQIFNTAENDIGNLRTNCPLVWGPLESNYALWQSQGSYYLAETSATAPVLFFYNTDDASYYQHQITHFKAKLDSLGVPTSTLVNYGTLHAVPQTSVSLAVMYSFFKQYLTPPSVVTGLNNLKTPDAASENLSFVLSTNPVSNELNLKFNLQKAGKGQITLYNQSGIELHKIQKNYENGGQQTEKIRLSELNLPRGIYCVKIIAEGRVGTGKFMKD